MPSFNCDPNADTAGLVDLSDGWRDCTSIVTFPAKDFSSGVNFSHTWDGCTAIESMAQFYLYYQLSNAPAFVSTWEGCNSLFSFQDNLNLSSATLFDRTWKDCSSLTSFPFITVDSGVTFNQTWESCTSLTSFPLLNVSSGTNFVAAWYNCNSLTSFPELDTSQGTNFAGTWAGCSSLSSFPLLNTSQGTNFWLTWVQCGGLTSFPLLNTSQGTNFQSTWEQCSGLTSFPPLNLSQGTNFAGTWLGCVSLADFPPNMFDSSLTGNFYQAWEVCALTPQSVENIFVSLDTSGVTGGTLSVAGGTNACFGDWTVLATAAYDSLIGKSWTIDYNYCPAEALITLIASPAAVVGGGTFNIVFSFTRTGSTVNPLTVNFNVGGTATLGTDYTQSGAASFSPTNGSILIPAGQTTGQITIDPSPGASIVNSETVEITLVSGSGYTPVTINPVVATIYENISPVAIQQSIYIRSILEVIGGNLLTGEVNTPGPDPQLPVVSVPPVVGTGGPDYQIFELISDSIGSYGVFTLSSNGDFEYTVDLTNAIVGDLSPYTPPYYTQVSEPFQFRVTDLAGNTSEGVVNVTIQASYTRVAAAFTFNPIPPIPPNQGKKKWWLNDALISTLANPNYTFFGLNYPWSGPVTDPPPYIAGYTDQPGNWLLGGPPPDGFFD